MDHTGNNAQGICNSEVVKLEISLDEGDVPVILPQQTTRLVSSDVVPSSNSLVADPAHSQTSSVAMPTESNPTRAFSSNSELIRIFGHTSSQPVDIDGNPILQAGSLASQFCPLGPKERCTASQAQTMGEQILKLMITHENNGTPLPFELQNTFDIFHRCLAVAYGTFFLNLYTKANAPCVLCHGCKSLYPPGQYIHHSCLALPPNIVACRSRMWRRCLVPLMSQDMNKADQKERWKFVLEKFSHASNNIGKRNSAHVAVEPQLLEMPECKRGKFVDSSDKNKLSKSLKGKPDEVIHVDNQENPTPSQRSVDNDRGNLSPVLIEEDLFTPACSVSDDEQSGGGDVSIIERSNHTSKAMGMLTELIKEVNRLEQELSETREKLKRTEDKLKTVTLGESLSEQLVQSLLSQEKMAADKKELLKKLNSSEEKSAKLEKQLNTIQMLHGEMQNQLKT